MLLQPCRWRNAELTWVLYTVKLYTYLNSLKHRISENALLVIARCPRTNKKPRLGEKARDPGKELYWRGQPSAAICGSQIGEFINWPTAPPKRVWYATVHLSPTSLRLAEQSEQQKQIIEVLRHKYMVQSDHSPVVFKACLSSKHFLATSLASRQCQDPLNSQQWPLLHWGNAQTLLGGYRW